MKEQVAEIVAAYLRNNSVSPTDVPTEDRRTRASRAVPIRRSVNPEYVTCLVTAN